MRTHTLIGGAPLPCLLLALAVRPAVAGQLVSGSNMQVYYDSNGHWNDDSTGYGLQYNHGGSWVDYSYPGTPYAMWSLEFDDSSTSYHHYTHYSYGSTMTVVSESDDSTSTTAIATYEMDAGPLTVVKRESWAMSSGAMLVELELTNDGSSTVDNIRFMQAVDPDQDAWTYSNYNTYNDTLDRSGDGDPDYAESVGGSSGRTIGFGACDDDISEMGHFDSWSVVTDADYALSDYGYASGDLAVGLRIDSPVTLDPGDSVTLSYVVVIADSASAARTLYDDALTDLCNNCDSDGDGYEDEDCDGTDCDDSDADVYPGADEYCNDIDDDCDGDIDEDALDMEWWYDDDDSDGFGDPDDRREACDEPAGHVDNDDDCDDRDPDVNPDASEVCNDVDDDCDGYIDEGATDASTWYEDGDRDGFGGDDTARSCDRPDGYTDNSDDCDDDNAAVNPDATEICNGIDDDCNGIIDTDAADTTTWYHDGDSDSYGDPDDSVDSCEGPDGYVLDATDCDDDVAAVNPGATEVCNGIDDDCDGDIDSDAVDMDTWYPDADSDGYGDGSAGTDACDEPKGWTDDGSDCDDGDASINPGAAEIPYDGIDNDCDDGDLTDVDGDGHDCECVGGDDCDDSDADTYPGAEETADGVDNDCDDTVDEETDWYDDDGDGFAEAGGDCDDTDPDVSPADTETPDGVDEDCDGIVDEGTTAYDDDGDGFTEDEGDCNDADADVSPDAAEVTGNGIDDDCDGVVDDGTTDEDRDGYAPWAGDCDDTDDTVYPGAPELPDGIDNDCDDVVDEGTTGYDDDGDGWTEAAGDCDDTNAATSPDGEEIPGNGMDDDCDGDVDEDSELTDDDGDGFSEVAGDCDDTDEDVNPGATEIEGNGIDDDCDDETDEVASDDGDGDGFTTGDGDCDDTDGWAWPGATEFCDGVDNNCDGVVDEDCLEAEVTEEGDKDGGCGCGAVPGQQRGLAAVFGLLLGGLVLRRRR